MKSHAGVNQPSGVEHCAYYATSPFKVSRQWFEQTRKKYPNNPEYFVEFKNDFAAVLVGGFWNAYELVEEK